MTTLVIHWPVVEWAYILTLLVGVIGGFVWGDRAGRKSVTGQEDRQWRHALKWANEFLNLSTREMEERYPQSWKTRQERAEEILKGDNNVPWL